MKEWSGVLLEEYLVIVLHFVQLVIQQVPGIVMMKGPVLKLAQTGVKIIVHQHLVQLVI